MRGGAGPGAAGSGERAEARRRGRAGAEPGPGAPLSWRRFSPPHRSRRRRGAGRSWGTERGGEGDGNQRRATGGGSEHRAPGGLSVRRAEPSRPCAPALLPSVPGGTGRRSPTAPPPHRYSIPPPRPASAPRAPATNPQQRPDPLPAGRRPTHRRGTRHHRVPRWQPKGAAVPLHNPLPLPPPPPLTTLRPTHSLGRSATLGGAARHRPRRLRGCAEGPPSPPRPGPAGGVM